MRINIALADETLGDTALEEGDADEAAGWWQAGIDALAEGDCPTDSGRGQDQTRDAADVDQRLRDKLQQQQQEEQQQQQQQDDEEQTPEERREQREQERKERKLEERNDDAIEQEQNYEESNRDRDFSQYHW